MRLLALQDEAREAQLPPQERVQAVRPFWETLSQEQRVQLLSLGLEELRAKAAEVTARLKRQHSGMPAPCQRCQSAAPPAASALLV